MKLLPLAALFLCGALAAAPASSRKAAPPPPDRAVVYKQAEGQELKLHIFLPAGWTAADKRPLMLMYHGGGWRGGQTADFFLQCRWYADQGFVAVSADYRLADKQLSRESMTHTLQDAFSAIRYARKHAAELGIDPTKVVASGSSAGGHLSLAISLFSDYNDPADDTKISPVPNALVLLCPVIDCGPPPGYSAAYRWMKEYYLPFSPFQNVRKGMPPQIIVLGTLDHVTPPAHAEAYQKKVRELGNVCELKLFPDVKHGAFYRGKNWTAAQPIIEEFLKKQGLWP